MLTYLHVKNIALIDELEVDFDGGFNILTGETGAGKSIIIGSINAVLGSKVSKDFIRKDEENALVELMFQVTSKDVLKQLKDLEIDCDGEVLISRKISQNGRSVFKVNGQVVNAEGVKNMTSLLIDLHSQHEHQSLLEKKNHIRLLDKYLGNKVELIQNELKAKYKKYQQLKNEIKEFSLDHETIKREISFLEYEIVEIENAQLTPGEDELLDLEYKKQSNIQSIQSTLSNIREMIDGQDHISSVSFQVTKALELMNRIKGLDHTLVKLTEQLEQIDFILMDFNHDTYEYIDNLIMDEEALDYTRKRIDTINGLKMKHSNNIEEILLMLEVKREKHQKLLHHEESLEKIRNEMMILEREIIDLCKSLTTVRVEGSKELSKQIVVALKDLNLNNTDFLIQCLQKEAFGPDGWDDVEFMISTNIGENMKQLIQIASGGELSRVMLAIKSVLADCDEISTLIFDEIDNGISGRTAQMVAEKMVRLSRSRQLICISHLPQIAAMADNHYLIEKRSNNDKTITTMVKLKEEEIPNELSRLIGGAKITESIQKSAIEMKKLANEVKGV
ncbi:MAG: DNA repair protein RecN [Firmicutes bacterium HGW-Firmicutes-1]|jgi:DNA repair protein RecN (Recombination protein N)|nr:MAG: DNA repair protein RecN [Firmicutes bacterium HGW-Firmicutes-1]